jgi:hypothetical protein
MGARCSSGGGDGAGGGQAGGVEAEKLAAGIEGFGGGEGAFGEEVRRNQSIVWR